MVLLVKINTTDSMSIDFLDKAKHHRKMSQVIADSIAHYCRTPEGQKSLEMLELLHSKSKKTSVNKAGVKQSTKTKTAKTGVDGKAGVSSGTVKQSKSIDDFLS